MATLFIVATPIGNLGDITFRAIETLKSVDVIACEDTRRTLKLLSHFDIRKPLVACYSYEEEKGADRILAALKEGKNVAYCSDAGTPGISDPGNIAVSRARELGHTVVPIPGPSALTALASVAGLPYKSIVFEGFLSTKPGKRRSRLAVLLERDEAVVLYESPFRVEKLLREIADIDGERKLCVGRELTKIHEEIVVGTAYEVLKILSSRERQKGEFTVLVSPCKKA